VQGEASFGGGEGQVKPLVMLEEHAFREKERQVAHWTMEKGGEGKTNLFDHVGQAFSTT